MFYEINGGSSIWECALVSTEGGHRKIVHNCLSGIGNMKGDFCLRKFLQNNEVSFN